MIRPALLAVLTAPLLTGGCVQAIAQDRVQSAMVEAGVSQRDADCMAGRMVDRLTIGQLRKLEALKAREGEPATPTTLSEYVERVRRVGDAKVVTVAVSSAALCAAGIG